ncbi:MAG: choice-of-anchor tandem repeat GloVer-containing protein, partial [Candidatus Cybelea sp.]
AVPRGSVAATIAAQHRSHASSFRVLYRFAGSPDGAIPLADLINVNGTLYGSTSEGGRSGCGYGLGCGTVYSITTTGSERVRHNFSGDRDGALPYAALINVKDTLYGTTRYGGGSGGSQNLGFGTIYRTSVSGSEKVLYRFTIYSNGTQPFAGLTNVNDTLYGTTAYGGPSGNGAVFRISATGVEKVLHLFTGSPDGSFPYSGLINVKGILYGTTWGGGTGCKGSGGCGTVYSISTNGMEKVLYSFAGGSDGLNPYAKLINVKGTLYGTTDASPECYSGGGECGTVFSVTTSGVEKVLHHFGRGSDGRGPYAGLIDVKGVLYGTTLRGGSTGCGFGCGTVYTVTTSGIEKVLHHFSGGSDGWFLQAGLIDVKGTLYGTTSFGGKSGCGSGTCGTVFALSP